MKKNKKIITSSILLVLAALIASKLYILSLLFLILFFIVFQVILSDHLDKKIIRNSQWNINSKEKITPTNGKIIIPDKYKKNYTLFLELRIKSNFLGYIFDPYIKINNSEKQFFDRAANGKRHINISHSEKEIVLSPTYCKIFLDAIYLIAYKNPVLDNKKILILSPHPDDAEIAAFGLYSKNPESMIVTITSGESDAEHYLKLTESPTQASYLKGKLRAWNSVAIPIWAGKHQSQALNLGYFDQTLKSMHQSPELAHSSITSNISDISHFRVFNQKKLKTDSSGKATWNNLINDLVEILQAYKPDFIITPDEDIDIHTDHIYTTKAIKQATKKIKYKNTAVFLYYANHLKVGNHWPYGDNSSLISFPPIDKKINREIYSHSLSKDCLINKACSLEMMHDLRFEKTGLKKRFRAVLQKLLIGRNLPFFGHNSYYRTAVKPNELFYRK